jgi:UDP-N-acetylglucosamine 4,6-dehydratase/5-epimerase
MNIMSCQSVLITGGTGSFGNAFVRRLLAMKQGGPFRICILSRDELKQAEMAQALGNDSRLRFFVGDVRDQDRLELAFHGIDIVVHAAAMKQVPACEYNPFEAVLTNVVGSQNVATAALNCGVKRVVGLSSDKACAPLNMYGASKACLEKLLVAANSYRGKGSTRFSVVRYGNVAGSRGSVIPLWKAAIAAGQPIRVFDPEATRFWFTLDGAVDLVLWTLTEMTGGELVVPMLSSFKLLDLVEALHPGWPVEVVGHRAGDKRAESMVSPDEAVYFRAYRDHLVRFLPGDLRGLALPDGFQFRSGVNDQLLGPEQLRAAMIQADLLQEMTFAESA